MSQFEQVVSFDAVWEHLFAWSYVYWKTRAKLGLLKLLSHCSDSSLFCTHFVKNKLATSKDAAVLGPRQQAAVCTFFHWFTNHQQRKGTCGNTHTQKSFFRIFSFTLWSVLFSIMLFSVQFTLLFYAELFEAIDMQHWVNYYLNGNIRKILLCFVYN